MTVLPACANCSTALNGPFCSNCGQKASDFQRPIWWILGEFLDSVFGYDSRTFRTMWLLFAVPGEFTRRYNAGKRASMLPPFRLFVIATLVFFVTLQMSGIAIVAFQTEKRVFPELTQEAKEQIRRTSPARIEIKSGDAVEVVSMRFFVPAEAVTSVKLSEESRRSMIEVSDDFRQDKARADSEERDMMRWLEARARRIAVGYEHALADPLKLNAPLNLWLPRLMLLLVPLFAMLLAGMHWSPRVFLFEHLIFSLHLHTVFFIALALTAGAAAMSGDSSFMWAVWTLLAVYLWMAMYRVYGRSWWLTSLKFMALLAIYSVILSAGLGIIFLLALSEI